VLGPTQGALRSSLTLPRETARARCTLEDSSPSMKLVLFKTVWGCPEIENPSQWKDLVHRIKVRSVASPASE
jgi:hypothetical protein